MPEFAVESLPTGLQTAIARLKPRAKSVWVNLNRSPSRYEQAFTTFEDGYRSYIPTYLVNMATGEMIEVFARSQYASIYGAVAPAGSYAYTDLPVLTSGKAVIYTTDRGSVVVSMLKDDEKHIKTATAHHMDNPLVRELLYVYTKINSRGSYRAEAKERIVAHYGAGSIEVATDALLEDGLIKVNKAGAVTATPKGLQMAATLTYDDEPSYHRHRNKTGRFIKGD